MVTVGRFSRPSDRPVRTATETLDLWVGKLSALLAAGDMPIAILTASHSDNLSMSYCAHGLARASLTRAKVEQAVSEALDNLELHLLEAPPRVH